MQPQNSCPHIKPMPGKKGKIFWLSGPPGAGKSTTCQLMARKHDFVYYEADATMQFINPFVDLNVENPTVAAFAGKSLKVKGKYTYDVRNEGRGSLKRT